MKTRLRSLLGWLGKRVLMRLARCCIWHARTTNICWICGGATGMGPHWNGHMTCDRCYEEWHHFHRPRDGVVVDWRGLGRIARR